MTRTLSLSDAQVKVLAKMIRGIGLSQEELKLKAAIRLRVDAMVEGMKQSPTT